MYSLNHTPARLTCYILQGQANLQGPDATTMIDSQPMRVTKSWWWHRGTSLAERHPRGNPLSGVPHN